MLTDAWQEAHDVLWAVKEHRHGWRVVPSGDLHTIAPPKQVRSGAAARGIARRGMMLVCDGPSNGI